MYRKSVIALLFFLSTTSVSLAQDAKREDVDKMVTLMQLEKTVDQMMVLLVPQFTKVARSSNPNISQKVLDIIEQSLTEVFRSNTGSFKDIIVELYRGFLTEAEVKAAIAFYSTPEGQSIIEKQPQMIAAGSKAGELWALQVMPQAQKRFAELLAEQQN